MKTIAAKIIAYLKSSLPWAWKFIIRAAKYPTGQRLLAIAIVAAAAALGLDWPFERVQDAIAMATQRIGADGTVSLEVVIGGIIGGILADGMFRANDKIADVKRIIAPKRMYVRDMADPPPSMLTKVMEGASRKVSYYEVTDGALICVAEDGARRDVTAVMTEMEQQLRDYLQAQA